MATLGRGYTFGATEQVTNTKLHSLVDSGTVSGIVNADIDGSAGIVNSKLNLTSISQAVTLAGGVTITTNPITMTSEPVNEAKGSDISSVGGTPAIGAATGNTIHITGTTTITAFDTVQAGVKRELIFDGILTLTHNGTSLILPTGANITTAAGDTALMVSEGSGNWRCVRYQKKDGTPLVAASGASQAQMEAASSTSVAVTPGVNFYHPGVAKAWCMFNGAASGTAAPTVGYNVTSVTRNTTGDYTINLTNAFSTANYAPFCQALSPNSANSVAVGIKNGTVLSASAFTILTTPTNNVVADCTLVSVIVYGDLP